jgi:hypothetical protein
VWLRGTDESEVEMDAPEETPDQTAQFIASLTQRLAQIARPNRLDTLSYIVKWRGLTPISASSARNR